MNFKSILAIGAHPDDVEISCFGFLAKQRNEGSNIHVFVVSPDSLSDGGLMYDRIEETKKAFDSIPGVNLNFRYKNNIVYDDYQPLSEDIRKLVVDNHIDLVLIHSKDDTMQEHRLLHDITMTALRRLPVSVFTYRSPSTQNFNHNLIIDISKYYDIKIKALQEHKTQSNKTFLSEDSIKIFNQSWDAKMYGIDFYEGFDILRIIDRRAV